MAKFILVANWKNHPASLLEVSSLLALLAKKASLFKTLSTYIAPPAPYLEAVSKRSFVKLAAQDLSLVPKGSHTGEVTPEILQSFGVKLVIIGHSERRALGETSKEVSEKVRLALKCGFTPLVCVGEKEHSHDGEHFEFLREEIKKSLEGLRKQDAEKIMLAYEPVWAIGKSAKEAMTPQDLAQTIVFIRKVVSDLFGRKSADAIPLLYGAAVEISNASLLRETGIRGLLVGHASLKAKDFIGIATAINE